jgi:cell division protein YceG involved in septum cleavage
VFEEAFLRTQKIPGPNCEGYLFPETYMFARGVSPKTLFETFFKSYKATFNRVVHPNSWDHFFPERHG